ncbi:hypothetical protein [Kangiella marina]|uniref:UrcA family protein n=1 Tax=Kangiella marina TaxID=1079178 RepID=A0ABP8IAP0_9GAMM
MKASIFLFFVGIALLSPATVNAEDACPDYRKFDEGNIIDSLKSSKTTTACELRLLEHVRSRLNTSDKPNKKLLRAYDRRASKAIKDNRHITEQLNQHASLPSTLAEPQQKGFYVNPV